MPEQNALLAAFGPFEQEASAISWLSFCQQNHVYVRAYAPANMNVRLMSLQWRGNSRWFARLITALELLPSFVDGSPEKQPLRECYNI